MEGRLIAREKRSNKFWKVLLVVIGLLVAAGWIGLSVFVNGFSTSEKHRPLLDIQDSHLMTPTGPIRFEFADTAGYSADENSAGKRIFVVRPAYENAPHFKVSFGIFDANGTGSNPRVFISDFTSAFDQADLVVGQGAFYQLNQNAIKDIAITKNIGTNSKPGLSDHPVSLYFNWPGTLADYDISMTGGSMWPTKVPIVEAGKNDTHYLFVPFTLGAEKFAIHLRFKVRVNSFDSIGVYGP